MATTKTTITRTAQDTYTIENETEGLTLKELLEQFTGGNLTFVDDRSKKEPKEKKVGFHATDEEKAAHADGK